jgi:hypothetical protein
MSTAYDCKPPNTRLATAIRAKGKWLSLDVPNSVPKFRVKDIPKNTSEKTFDLTLETYEFFHLKQIFKPKSSVGLKRGFQVSYLNSNCGDMLHFFATYGDLKYQFYWCSDFRASNKILLFYLRRKYRWRNPKRLSSQMIIVAHALNIYRRKCCQFIFLVSGSQLLLRLGVM